MSRWIVKQYQADFKRIADRYHISEILAEVLVKRELFDWESMDRYLYSSEDKMYAPEQLMDVTKAARILKEKIMQGRKICVIGDYDVDGVMSSCILIKGIIALGGDVCWRIPHRVKDGYGIREYMVEEVHQQGVDTIITCDNGISAWDAVNRAKQLGMTVILTDHHEVPVNEGKEVLPPADAVINPKQQGCTYPFAELCGGAVTYKLMEYLLKESGRQELLRELLVFAAIATICDVVTLQDENRIIVKLGLQQIKNSRNIGLQMLIEKLGYQREITSRDVGFGIGPCLNAAGRLDDAARGLELLLEQDREKAAEMADYLIVLNEERKQRTSQAVREAEEQIQKQGFHQPVLVLYLENCHESVAGIVAGRIREAFYRPVFILTKSGDLLKGSGRSVPGYHMQMELSRCRELLTEYGGHEMAAGCSLPAENLDSLRERLNSNCTLTEEQLEEKIIVDREVPLGESNRQLVEQLQLLQPAGQGNEEVVFARCGLQLCSVRIFGKEHQISRCQIRDQGETFYAVDFNLEQHLKPAVIQRYGAGAWEELERGCVKELLLDILYTPEINVRYGDVQYRILDCR